MEQTFIDSIVAMGTSGVLLGGFYLLFKKLLTDYILTHKDLFMHLLENLERENNK